MVTTNLNLMIESQQTNHGDSTMLVTIRQACLQLGEHLLFDHIDLQLHAGERIGLLGRNGAGKSTLLKVLTGKIELDSGEIEQVGDVQVCMLDQDVPNDMHGTIFQIVLSGLQAHAQLLEDYHRVSHAEPLDTEMLIKLQEQIEQHQVWQAQQRVDAVLSRLGLDPGRQFSTLSGGLKRQVILARALVADPDILLLDEPTNHLDIEAIQWLEQFLPSFKGCLLFITHDRVFLQNIATRIVELDRGHLISFEGRYQKFLAHKQTLIDTEKSQNALFDKRLAEEEVWIRKGVKARTTRNEGRVRKLMEMRDQRENRRDIKAAAMLKVGKIEASSRVVIRAKNISFGYGDYQVFESFSLQINRGDRIGIVGRNGCGKSSLIRCLLGLEKPNAGTVKLGENLNIAYFDQMRGELDEEESLAYNIADGAEYIECNGKRQHVFGYLRKFLFSPERANSPISVLSGGERNRLLLAKILAKPNNVLVLDEPTNDLDMETLDMLENMLLEYPGTLIIVSHDRQFLDNVVTSTLLFDNSLSIHHYLGGYTRAISQYQQLGQKAEVVETKPTPESNKIKKSGKPRKMTYGQRLELEAMPAKIETMEAGIVAEQSKMAEPSFYQQEAEAIKAQQQKLADLTHELETMYDRWNELERLASALE